MSSKSEELHSRGVVSHSESSAEDAISPDVALVKSKIKVYSDFPIPNQPFADIFPIFRDPVATEAVISHLVAHIQKSHDLTQIAGLVCLESRGFFFAPIIASRLSLPCVPVRKRGKLPGDKISVTFQKEYGPDVFEMKTDAFEGIERKKIIIVDDLLAKGGSVMAAKELCERLEMEVVECVFIFDVPAYYGLLEERMKGLERYAMVHLE